MNAAINYKKLEGGCDAALDEMYEKFVVRPIQKAWIQRTYCVCCYVYDKINNKYYLKSTEE